MTDLKTRKKHLQHTFSGFNNQTFLLTRKASYLDTKRGGKLVVHAFDSTPSKTLVSSRCSSCTKWGRNNLREKSGVMRLV